MKILEYLKQPFPKAEKKWRTIFFISLFITLFLLFFQPFGISRIEGGSRKNLFIGGFGLVSFIVLIFDLIIVERIFYRFFEEKNWRLYKELFWLFFIVFSIGLANVLYSISFSSQRLTISYFVSYMVVTMSVALFPIAFFTISKQNFLFKNNTASAKDVNDSLKAELQASQQNKPIIIYSYNEKAKEEFDINNLYYIESKGNDIELILYENEQIIRKTLRNTLKKTLVYLTDSPELVQCHRAYIVNLNKVIRVEGNSQGLVLKLANCDIEVPVSRSFVSTIKSKLG